jgi:hypothetical protein
MIVNVYSYNLYPVYSHLFSALIYLKYSPETQPDRLDRRLLAPRQTPRLQHYNDCGFLNHTILSKSNLRPAVIPPRPPI